jgi:ribosomal protein S16
MQLMFRFITFVHARLVEQLGHFKRFLFVRLNRFGDDHPEFVQQRVADCTERRVGRFVIIDECFLYEISTRELIEIIARVYRRIHVVDDGGRYIMSNGFKILLND